MIVSDAIRRTVLAAGLAVTLGLSAWTHWRQQRTPEVVEASAAVVARAAPSTGTPASPGHSDAGLPLRAQPDGTVPSFDPFAVRSWAPPPPPPEPPPPPAPVPEPIAPPLPFQYMGRQEQVAGKGQTVFFLTRGDEVHTVTVGQVLGEYRFDGMEQGLLRFTYLPLSTVQEMSIGMNP